MHLAILRTIAYFIIIIYRSLFKQCWLRLRVGVDSHFVPLLIDNRELITGIRFQEVILQATLLPEWLRCWVLPFFKDVVIFFKISQQVDGESVILVKLVTISAFQDFQGFSSTSILNKHIPEGEERMYYVIVECG